MLNLFMNLKSFFDEKINLNKLIEIEIGNNKDKVSGNV